MPAMDRSHSRDTAEDVEAHDTTHQVGSEANSLTEQLLQVRTAADKAPSRDRLSLIISATGNFSVQYNFQAIAVALSVMQTRYPEEAWVDGTLSTIVFAGTVVGMIVFGFLGDVMGRNIAMRLTLVVATAGSLCSAVAPWGSAREVYSTIAVCRFVMGLGLGGVYPLSSAKAAESASTPDPAEAARKSSWAFFWQIPGAMAVYALGMALVCSPLSSSWRFRVVLGVGTVFSMLPAIATLRSQDSEAVQKCLQSPRGPVAPPGAPALQVLAEGAAPDRAALEGAHVAGARLWTALQSRRTCIELVGTGGAWLVYDVAYYGVNLFGPKIIRLIFHGSGTTDKALLRAFFHQFIANALGIPAIWATVLLTPSLGLKRLQVWGFVLIAACFAALGGAYAPLHNDDSPRSHSKAILVVLYMLLMMSLNAGPNLTTFVLPAATFPPQIRTSFNGVSSACGKIGAIVGGMIFGPIADLYSLDAVMYFCAALSLVGALLSHLCIDGRRF